MARTAPRPRAARTGCSAVGTGLRRRGGQPAAYRLDNRAGAASSPACSAGRGPVQGTAGCVTRPGLRARQVRPYRQRGRKGRAGMLALHKFGLDHRPGGRAGYRQPSACQEIGNAARRGRRPVAGVGPPRTCSIRYDRWLAAHARHDERAAGAADGRGGARRSALSRRPAGTSGHAGPCRARGLSGEVLLARSLSRAPAPAGPAALRLRRRRRVGVPLARGVTRPCRHCSPGGAAGPARVAPVLPVQSARRSAAKAGRHVEQVAKDGSTSCARHARSRGRRPRTAAVRGSAPRCARRDHRRRRQDGSTRSRRLRGRSPPDRGRRRAAHRALRRSPQSRQASGRRRVASRRIARLAWRTGPSRTAWRTSASDARAGEVRRLRSAGASPRSRPRLEGRHARRGWRSSVPHRRPRRSAGRHCVPLRRAAALGRHAPKGRSAAGRRRRVPRRRPPQLPAARAHGDVRRPQCGCS